MVSDKMPMFTIVTLKLHMSPVVSKKSTFIEIPYLS